VDALSCCDVRKPCFASTAPRSDRIDDVMSAFVPKRIGLCDVRYWPLADIPSCTARVRFRGQSGHDFLRRECLLLTQTGHQLHLLSFFAERYVVVSVG
jgi:hypothetical protein